MINIAPFFTGLLNKLFILLLRGIILIKYWNNKIIVINFEVRWLLLLYLVMETQLIIKSYVLPFVYEYLLLLPRA